MSFLLGASLAAILASGSVQDPANPMQQRYQDCLAEVERDPEIGYETGLAWRAQGGGWAAEHCAAMGQLGMGELEPAARRMQANAEGAVMATGETRAIMLAQAGAAWLELGRGEDAYGAYLRALDFDAGNAGLARGAARGAEMSGERLSMERAGQALIDADPEDPEGWRLRGQARLEAGEFDRAEADMERARQADAEYIPALVLRGDIAEARRMAERPEEAGEDDG